MNICVYVLIIFIRCVKLAGYSVLDIGHSNVQCPISNIRLTSRSYTYSGILSLIHFGIIWQCKMDIRVLGSMHSICKYIYIYILYNYEKYPLSPSKPRFLVLIEQNLSNISDPVYSVHQSFMWFVWLNWRKSTFIPVTAPNDSKCWPIVTSSIQEPAASNERLFPGGYYGRFLRTMMLRTVI